MKRQTAVLLAVIAALLVGTGFYAHGDGATVSRWFAALHGQ